MSTTAEIVAEMEKRARELSTDYGPFDVVDHGTAKLLRAAAARLDELERENARLREALFETHLDLVAYADIEVARKRLVKRRAALAGSEKP